MMSHETRDQVRIIIGIIGNVISFGLFLSPLPTFVQIWKKKAVEDFSPIPYIATLLNCALWVFYGMPFVHPNSILVITINGTGLVLESIYIIVFFVYSPRELRRKVIKFILIEVVFMAVFIAVVLSTCHTYERRSRVVGIFCIIFGTIMYASPLSVMKLVIATKSVKYMPFSLSLAGFLNGVCWTTYAFLPIDINLIIPNGLGTIFGFVQLVIYGIYYRSTPKVEDETRKVEMSSL